ncbi:MAG: hypothetical protein JWO81_3253 [Alphaproteobacteria bacterium]|nr:hypothetical protein [Alphaproteobacteria bacterium]
MKIARSGPVSARERTLRILLYAAWCALVLLLVSRHVFWRDEVRAVTIALAGDSVPAMLRILHGEGHPAIWYLLLRGAHAIVPVRQVLPAVSVIVAAAAMAVLVFRAPFRPAVFALILFGAFGMYEYAVVARNYGISMLVLFALAALYPRWRDRGIVIGLVLALLCNTNVPSALLAAAFLLFWLVELVGEEGLRWSRRYGMFVLNAAVAAAGALLCFLTVYPTVHDAAAIQFHGSITPSVVWSAVSTPAATFWAFVPPFVRATPAAAAFLGLLVFGSLLGLLRSPAAFLSALVVFLGFELFFQLIYPGYYRHEALLLVYLVTLYWLVAEGRGGAWPEAWRVEARLGRLPEIGTALFLVLLGLQVVTGAGLAAADLNGIPYSRSRDLAALLKREHLTDAVLVADPDTLLEPLSYYAPNPIYLMRRQRFDRVVRFTGQVRRELSVDDYLRDARILQARTGRPVVILFQRHIDGATRPFHILEVYNWAFSGTPEQVRRFQASTRRLARFAPAITDESYDVYLLNAPKPVPAPPAPPAG